MNTLKFNVVGKGEIEVDVKYVFNAGYVGRNQQLVRDHIEELGKLGIPAPSTSPTLYPLSNYVATNDEKIQVQNEESSGEMEYVLIYHDGKVYVTIGSDQTDRNLETFSVPKSKQAAQDVIAKDVWDFDEVKDHFEEIEVECWVEKGDKRELYQKGTIADILQPEDWKEVMEEYNICENGNIFFSGSFNTVAKDISFADKYELIMTDKKLDRKIEFAYEVEFLRKGIE